MLTEIFTKNTKLLDNVCHLFPNSENTASTLISSARIENPIEAEVDVQSIVKPTNPSLESSTETISQSASMIASNHTEVKPENNDCVPAPNLKQDSIEKQQRTIFVGNVPTMVTQKENLSEFKRIFKQCGQVESIRFRSVCLSKPLPRKLGFIQKQFNKNRDTFNAYVVFKSADCVDKACLLNNSVFLDKHLRVDRVIRETTTEPKSTKKCVFVGNLSYDVQDETVHRHFSQCGDVDYVRIIRDK